MKFVKYVRCIVLDGTEQKNNKKNINQKKNSGAAIKQLRRRIQESNIGEHKLQFLLV